MVCPGESAQDNTWFQDNGIDVTQPFTMAISVHENEDIYHLVYTINGITVFETDLNASYQGGTFGLMTFGSTATFSNIQMKSYDVFVADKSDLYLVYDQATLIDQSKYTEDSVSILQDGLRTADEALAGNDQQSIDSATAKLQEAINGLVEKPAEESVDLDALIEQAKSLNQEDYIKETWDPLQTALEQAEKALNANDPEHQKTAYDALKKAIESLIKTTPDVVDKSILQALVDSVKDYKQEDYSIDTWTLFDLALKDAQDILNKEVATQKQVDACLTNLQNKIDSLKKYTHIVDEEGFKNVGVGSFNSSEGSYTLGNSKGDHFAMLASQETAAKDFSFKADVTFTSSDQANSAALVFGASSKKNPGLKWYGANVDTSRAGDASLFRVFGDGSDHLNGGSFSDIDLKSPLQLELDMKADGSFIFTFGNVDGPKHSVSGKIENWKGGFVGLLSYNSEATFTNVVFLDRTDLSTGSSLNLEGSVLENPVYTEGIWSNTNQGILSNGLKKGDCFLMSDTVGDNFVYSATLKFVEKKGAAGLVFRFNNKTTGKEGYGVNIDPNTNLAKFWRWQDDSDLQLIEEVKVAKADSYTIKVYANGGVMNAYINGVLIANLGDYTMFKTDLGQSTWIKSGYFGLLNFNSRVYFSDIQITPLGKDNTPSISDLTISSHDGEVEKKGQFFPESPNYIQFVKNSAETVYIKTESDGDVTLSYNGQSYKEEDDIPIVEGNNIIEVVVDKDGNKIVYHVNAYKYGPEENYYKEPYRGQYHYSVKEGWGNDPNGMIYYNGKYHFFYQFYNDIEWGPMHWAHATSTDMIHWEEEPITFYPDMNGTMFNGYVVPDETNSTGLFSTDKGGLVAIITVDGNGQRMKLAISEDEGTTWKKANDIALDWTDDALLNRDMRDPQIFHWEGKWFMLLAGGPFRIYSSENLKDWKAEALYPDLHTECPDLYPVQADDGQIKWVFSGGGRFYKIGDFKEVDGVWTFVPDDYYKDKNGVMNFGKDSYAAMRYYEGSFGTSENPTLHTIKEVNWMNTWDYCRDVARVVGQKFNATYNLTLNVGVINEDGIYKLTQTPIEQYKDLRDIDHAIEHTNVMVGDGNDPLEGFTGDTYEIVSTFYPEEGTKKVGFDVRMNDKGQKTRIEYDLENNTISIDRSKSGIQINDRFTQVDSQAIESFKATRNADNSITLHIFVDKSSVEVFSHDYTVAGANQIFPDSDSVKASMFAEGTPVKADLSVYPLKSVWAEQEASEEDKANLKAAIEQAEQLDTTLYTKEGVDKLTVSIKKAQDALALEKPTVKDVRSALGELNATINNMSQYLKDAEKHSKEQLKAKIDEVNAFDASKYSPASWALFSNALTQANQVLANENATADEIDQALSKLSEAQKGLVSAPNKSLLAQAIEANSQYDPAPYTQASWDVFAAALKNARNVLNDPNATQEQVDAALSQLNTARTQLKNEDPSSTSKDSLNNAFQAASKLEEGKYTSESWKALQTALENAKNVFTKENATADEINDATTALNEAISKLEEKKDEAKPSEKPGTDTNDVNKTNNKPNNSGSSASSSKASSSSARTAAQSGLYTAITAMTASLSSIVYLLKKRNKK